MLLATCLTVFAEVAITVPAPSDWANESVDLAHEWGIAEKSRQYRYKDPITREEFCEMIYNLILSIKKEVDAVYSSQYTDTDNRKMLVLSGLGIINGKSETELSPEDYLTREEAATIIVRMINKTMPMPATEMWFEFDDADDISPWAVDSVQTICNLGFMKGVGENKFEPQMNFTTEQAIVALVRVYKSVNAAEVEAAEKESIEDFVVTETITLDNFYVDEALKLVSASGKMASNKNYISLYTSNDEMTEKILAIGEIDFSNPKEVYYISMDRKQIVENIKSLMGDEADKIDFEALIEWNKLNLSTLPSLINASYGAENLAALTVLTRSRGYIMPESFRNDFALFLKYDGGYSAMVSFYEYGDRVISANMSFVKNGEKDNVLRRINEITSALGEGSIKIKKVE